jgi:hypothetical protein
VSDARSILAPVVRSSVEVAIAAGHKPIDPSELLG